MGFSEGLAALLTILQSKGNEDYSPYGLLEGDKSQTMDELDKADHPEEGNDKDQNAIEVLKLFMNLLQINSVKIKSCFRSFA